MSSSASSESAVPATLDRNSFTKYTPALALCMEARKCSLFRQKLEAHIVRIPKYSPIRDDPRPTPSAPMPEPGAEIPANVEAETKDAQSESKSNKKQKRQQQPNPTYKALVLDPKYKDVSELPEDMQAFIKAERAEVVPYSIEVGYENLSADQVLRAFVPSEIEELPSSFEAVGHIAHVNLRTPLLPYKHLIGQIIIDKNPSIRTVVNKTGQIESEFREFPMEVIAGDSDLMATVHESGCTFKFNYSEVYWNSRLQKEHGRILDALRPGKVVADMFAGVGPFAIPAAKKGVIVYGNDLNPRSYASMVANEKINKLPKGKLHAFNMDGRHFIRHLLHEHPSAPIMIDHVLMNLPATSVHFLDVFRGGFPRSYPADRLPIVHCYLFTNGEDPVVDAVAQCEQVIGASIDPIHVETVRDVAPKKLMMCVSFRVPVAAAYPAEDDAKGNRKRKEVDAAEEGEKQFDDAASKSPRIEAASKSS